MSSAPSATADSNPTPSMQTYAKQASAFVRRLDKLEERIKAKIDEITATGNAIEALRTEMGHIRNMFAIIDDPGLYDTALETYLEGLGELRGLNVCTEPIPSENLLTSVRPSLIASRLTSTILRIKSRR